MFLKSNFLIGICFHFFFLSFFDRKLKKKMFLPLFLSFSFSKRNFLDSEWDVYGTTAAGKGKYTAEFHPIENKTFYFSLWSDDGKNDQIIQTPDEAALVTAKFGFLSQNKILVDANYNNQQFHFETKFLWNDKKEEYLEFKISDFTTLTITFVNNSFIKSELVQIGKGKIAALNAYPHSGGYKLPFSIPTKYITYGSVGLFLVLQVRTLIKNIKEGPLKEQEEQEKNKIYEQIHVVKDDDEKDVKTDKKVEQKQPTNKSTKNKNKKKK